MTPAPKKPIMCATCGFPIFSGMEYRHNENFHAICSSDNGMTIVERRTAVETVSRQLLIDRRDDYQARMIMLRLGEGLLGSYVGEWESGEQREGVVKLQKAMIYMEDRAAYQEHVESGEQLQINDEGELRWAYPGEAR